MDTLYLNPNWDLALDTTFSLAIASNPYSQAQDAASEIRTFLGDCYYDQSQGLPYLTQILGYIPAWALIKAKMVAAALTVPGIVDAQVFILSFNNRQVQGVVEVANEQGVISVANF